MPQHRAVTHGAVPWVPVATTRTWSLALEVRATVPGARARGPARGASLARARAGTFSDPE